MSLLALGTMEVTAQDLSVKFLPIDGKPWDMKVIYSSPTIPEKHTTIMISPVKPIEVKHEKYDKLRLFDPKKSGWMQGERLQKLCARECTVCDALVPESVRVENENGTVYQRGKDYQLEQRWATIGRLEGGKINENTPVLVSYSYFPMRLDSIVLTQDGIIKQKIGQVNGATPLPPKLALGERVLGNLFFEKRPNKLSEEMLFPIMPKLKDAKLDLSETAALRLPKTLKKLRNGEPIKILAWGDSVTDMGYLPIQQRWTTRFVAELQQRFPKAKIELINLGWPGKGTTTFINQPAGSVYNYEEKVLKSGADLVTIEFVNDACLSEKQFTFTYGRVSNDLKNAGFEVIAITPHYTRPDWMNFTSQKNVDNDSRLYTKMLRRWAKDNGFALADVAERYGQVWRDGIPYNTFMVNSINHPDARGAQLFVDALIALFPKK